MSKPFYSPREIEEIRNDPGALLWELHQAAAYGDAGRVRECLDAGADVNGRNPDFGSTALMFAAAGNYREIANLLLERGARIDIADHGGRTAEAWADERHNEELADFLRSRRPLGARLVHAAGAALGLLKAYGPQTPAQARALGIGGLGARFGRSWHGETYRVAGGIPLCFDLRRPVGPGNKLPLVVLVHGGGWNGGSRNDASVSGMGDTLLAHGFAVATVDYRVAWDERFPGFRFPDPLCDVKAAVRHFRAHAEEFGIDPTRIGAFGHSAGAHLALLLGLTPAHPVLEKDSGDTAVSSAVRAVCGISCPCDFQTLVDVAKVLRAAVDADDPGKRRALLAGLSGRGDLAVILETMNVHDFPLAQRDLSDKATAMLWERKFNWSRPVMLARGLVHAESETLDALLAREKELLSASPLTHARRPAVAGPLPSFLLLHGGRDSLIPAEGCRLFGDALRGHGADCDVRIDPDAGHWHREAYSLVPGFFLRTLCAGRPKCPATERIAKYRDPNAETVAANKASWCANAVMKFRAQFYPDFPRLSVPWDKGRGFWGPEGRTQRGRRCIENMKTASRALKSGKKCGSPGLLAQPSARQDAVPPEAETTFRRCGFQPRAAGGKAAGKREENWVPMVGKSRETGFQSLEKRRNRVPIIGKLARRGGVG